MALTTMQLVIRLQKRGFQVTYRIRKDGGILITSINGQKYSGAAGNKLARTILGDEISQRRAQQLKTITRFRKPRRIPLPSSPEDLEKMRKRVMRKWRKANLRGSISKRNLRKIIEDRGIEEARKYLEEMERRTEGKAYFSSVDGLLARIKEDMKNLEGDELTYLNKLYDLVEKHREDFKEQWLLDIVEKLYDWENDKTGQIYTHDIYIFAKSLIEPNQ